MSNFVRRLKYYGIGFGIGLLFVIFFFKNRGCSWTPSNRVKSALLERVLVIPESQNGSLAKDGSNEKLIHFIEEADVDFNASNKRKPNKFYKLTHEGRTLYFTLTNESYISSVFTTKPKPKDTQNGMGQLKVFPNNDDLIFTDTSGNMQRIRTELGFKNDQEVLKNIKRNGYIDYGKSDFKDAIKPEHYIDITTKDGKKIGLRTVWYKDKINISEYILLDSIQ